MYQRASTALLFSILLFAMLIPGITVDESVNVPSFETNSPARNITEMVEAQFTENMGQISNEEIMFYSPSGSIAFTRNAVFLYSSNPDASNIIKLDFVESNEVLPEARNPAEWKSNFFIGDSENWRHGVTNYHEIVYENLWDGIDLVYYGQEGGIKYDFIIRPGSDPYQIKIHVSGHDSMSINPNGELNICTGLGQGSDIIDSGLMAFYADDNSKKIPAKFILIGQDTYTFMLGDIDSSRTVIIDPLIYSTFLGGSGIDCGTDVAAGDDGCAYIVGYTDSPDFMTTPGGYDRVYGDYTYDIFVAKMGLHGDSLVYSTFLGDEGLDHGSSIAVDGTGHAYITGHTSSIDFPTTDGAFDRTYNGDTYDAFVAKLSPMGDSLIYSTLLGGNRVEYGKGICVDDEGYAYVTGEAYPTPTPPPGPPEGKALPSQPSISSFPTTYGSFTWGSGLSDVFVTKLSQAGNELVYSTLFGTSEYETSNAIAIDGNGYAYITGYTRSDQYPTSTSAFDRSYAGSLDAFVTKLTPTGSSLAYSTYLGGSSSDIGYDIAVGQWGNAYVTGRTQSPEFPTTAGAFDTTHNGWQDVFVTILSKYGDRLTSSTFLGGTESDYGTGITIDSAGYALVTGSTSSDNFPVTDNAIDPTYGGNTDAFVAKLSTSGTNLFYSSYLGGNDTDQGTGIGVSPTGFTHVVGSTSSLDYPNTTGALDTTFNGDRDAFITKLDLESPYTDAGPDQRVKEGEPATFNAGQCTDNYAIANYTWTFYDGFSNITFYDVTATHTFYIPGDYPVNLKVTDDTGNWAMDTMILTILDITCPIAYAGQDQSIDEDTSVSFDGSTSSDNVGVTNYSWSFVHGGKDIILYGNRTVFNFTEPGIYTVLLTVQDAAGNEGEDELVVHVTDITRPVANAGDDVRIFNNKIITLDGTASNDNVAIVNYTWELNDGNVIFLLYGVRPAHLFNVIGSYTAILSVTDAVGLYDSDSLIITVLETVNPIAEAGPDLTTEEGKPTMFDGTASTDNIGVHECIWSFNDGLNDVTIIGSKPFWTFPLAGTYLITLDALDAAGNRDTDTLTVTVIDTTPPRVSAGPNQILTQGQEITFDSAGTSDNSGIANYTWTFTYNQTEIVLFRSTPNFTFWISGTYTITLTAMDYLGNSANSTLDITVLQQFAIQQETINSNDDNWMALASIVMILLGTLVLLLNRWRNRP